MPPGESEQAADQLAALFCGALGHPEHALLLLAELDTPLDQAQTPDHRREQVVKVMRDAAGQLADCVHLLRLDQLIFERTLLADIGQRSGEFDRLAFRVPEQHGLVEEMLVVAVGAHPAIFDR